MGSWPGVIIIIIVCVYRDWSKEVKQKVKRPDLTTPTTIPLLLQSELEIKSCKTFLISEMIKKIQKWSSSIPVLETFEDYFSTTITIETKSNKSSFQCYWCIQKSLGPSSAITMKCDAMKKKNVLLTTPEKARPNDLRHPRILINKNVRHKIQKKMHYTASSQTFLKLQFSMQTLRPRYSWNLNFPEN